MNQARGLRIITALFLLNLVIITWFELKLNKNTAASPIGWPRPSRYVGLGIAFGMLAVFAEIATAELAAVIAGGLTIGLLVNGVSSGNGTSVGSGSGSEGPGGQVGQAGGFLGGVGGGLAAGAGAAQGGAAGSSSSNSGFPTSSFQV